MTERPILFSAPMVRAILEGRKTQTRRVVKPQPSGYFSPDAVRYKCPYGAPSDRLWVRETFCVIDGCAVYRAEEPNQGHWQPKMVPWKPSIFMPRWASRITLDVVSVRVERLQEIGREDAIAEGVDYQKCPSFQTVAQLSAMIAGRGCSSTIDYIGGYKTLWESINGADSWKTNPWVWVVEFKRENSKLNRP